MNKMLGKTMPTVTLEIVMVPTQVSNDSSTLPNLSISYIST